jgi:hypothetical protein
MRPSVSALRPTVRTALAVLALVAGLAGLSACGDDSSGSPTDTSTKVIDVTFAGDSVTPNGERVTVGVNQPIQLVVKADKAGEMHVHSTPDQQLQYGAGTTTLSLKIDKPGLVTVESHALNKTIVQLEVK